MLNRVVLIGRLTKGPELRYTPNGIATTSFDLAVDRPYSKDKKETDFINIVTWRAQAENVAKYTKKGSLVAVEGRIQTRNYEKEGRKIYITEVVADNVRFLDTKKSIDNKEEPFTGQSEPIDISDDDLPF